MLLSARISQPGLVSPITLTSVAHIANARRAWIAIQQLAGATRSGQARIAAMIARFVGLASACSAHKNRDFLAISLALLAIIQHLRLVLANLAHILALIFLHLSTLVFRALPIGMNAPPIAHLALRRMKVRSHRAAAPASRCTRAQTAQAQMRRTEMA